MRDLNIISFEELREIFEYRDDGKLLWRKTVGSRGVKGRIAGRPDTKGYWVVNYKKKTYMLHRVIYAWHTGEWPPEIDHRNRVRDDCRIDNLRPLERYENIINSAYVKSKSGFRGVSEKRWGRKGQTRFCARLKIRGQLHELGYYKSPEEASKVYEEARSRMVPGVFQ